ncbi:MAG: hypothetical protein HY579_13545 [Nitrospinae bacterium]|nr:hypothetical protein [Nitrospinota bacterium]
MPEKAPPILVVDLGEYGGSFEFRSLDDIETGIGEEERRWSWIQDARPAGVGDSEILERQTDILHEVKEILLKARQANDDTQRQPHLDSIKEKLENHYNKERKGLNSNAPQAKLFFTDKWELRRDDPEVAFFALAYFLNHVPHSYLASPKCVIGMFKAFSFGRGMSWTEFKKPVEDFLKGAEERIKVFDEKIALEAPVRYWEKRKDHHESMSRVFARVAGEWVALGFSGLGFLAWKGLETDKTLSEMPFLHIFWVVAAASIFVWVGRVLVRLLLSHKHLEIDADERRVMILTYLAMLREGRAPTEDDRKLILASIFRPSATGIVKDDAMPFNLEMMQRLMASGK